MKKIKMLLYGEPGVGKSVFASKSPNPFFITTDGNYEWLEDFGAKPEAHTQVSSWAQAKQAFKSDFDGYDTVIVDLLEDLFKWCEYEFCEKARIDHVSDIGYGKGYDITRNEFFLELCKLLNKDKNIIFITHGVTVMVKDRRGVEHTKYMPSSRLPDKVLDMIEGRVRYCLRCYVKAEEQPNGTLLKNRYLSLVPKENEFGIIRGVDENTLPHDIPLEWSEFAKYIGFATEREEKKSSAPAPKKQAEKVVHEKKAVEVKAVELKPVAEEKTETEAPPWEENADVNVCIVPQTESEDVFADMIPEEKPIKKKVETVVEKPAQENPAPVKEEFKVLTNEEKLAAIRAKMQQIKNQNK